MIVALIGRAESITAAELTYRYYLRCRVPEAARPFYANPAIVESLWPGDQVRLLADLRAGALVERTGTAAIPNTGTAAAKRAAIEEAVLAKYNELRTEIENQATAPGEGTGYDDLTGAWGPMRRGPGG